MAALSNQQKKDYARTLFLKENLTQQELATRVDVSRQTINKWIKEEKWEEMKIGLTLGKEQQIANLHRQIAEINNTILDRDKGARYASPAEADTIGKIASSIKKMEGDVGVSDIISVGIRFVEYLRPIDHDKAKEIAVIWDKFLKAQL